VVLDDPGRLLCDECLPQSKAEALRVASHRALASLARRRADGIDPSHGGEAARKRGATNAKRIADARAFDKKAEPVDPETWHAVLARLKGVPVRRIAEATGLTRGYCSMVRRGLRVPHPRHWAALRELVDSLT
jgi:hypothetical protein